MSNLTPAPHNRIEELGKNNGGMSRSGSEPDSLLDLYRRNNSSSNLDAEADPDIPENMYRPEDDDPEGWIHRDKLAKIENEELQAAGINLANARRNVKMNRVVSSRGESNMASQPSRTANDEGRPQGAATSETDDMDDQNNWDLRTPEEILADEAGPTTPIYPNPVARKPGSKIPVLTSSPLPVPAERVERDTPMPRKRTLSGSLGPEETGPATKSRPRKSSGGSQALGDEMDISSTTPPTEKTLYNGSKTASPSKSKSSNIVAGPPSASSVPRKIPPTARKGSAIARPGASPGLATSPTPQPGTRSGEADRPRTALNRPEGDPPWLATMYKPDPMLHPDQQIIPTHARRQQQAQWTEEGAIPNTYDRDFSPLSVRSPDEAARQPTSVISKGDEGAAWPLKPVGSIRSMSSGRPGTSGSVTGGYSTMPKVTSPPIGVASPKPPMGQSPRISTMPPPRMQEHKRQDEPAQEDKTEKGCGCCVVM